MRVVLLVTDLERGGTPLRIARLARGLHAAGVEVFVGCLAPPGPVSSELEAAGIPTFACDAQHARELGAVKRLSEHVRQIRPDLIHATLTHANLAARLVGLYHRIPMVTSTATIEVQRGWHRLVEMLTGRLDRAHIVNSIALAEHVAQAFCLPRRHIRIVPPSVDGFPPRPNRQQVRSELGIPEHEFVVLWAGRLDPVKRLNLVIKCAEIMNVVSVRFLLAGEGPERARVERELRLSSAARIVHLLGWRDDLGRLMAAADALLFPSSTEGMPNVVLQALACGLPVVASDIATLRELSDGGRRMVLVAGDQPRRFADALLLLRDDAQRREALAQQAASWAAENLNPRATLAAVLRVYRHVLRARRVGRQSPSSLAKDYATG